MEQAGNSAQAVYQYIAYGKSGEVVKGKLSATNEGAVTELLGYAGYNVINVKELVPFINLDGLKWRFSRVKAGEVIHFYRQLALLLESGNNITASLELLLEQTSSRTLNRVLSEVVSDIRNGSQLSSALSKHPKVFPPIYCRSLSVGEQTGDLELMLRQIADYMEKEASAAKRTKRALMYPIFASIVAVVVVGILITFVLPAFSDLYSSLGAELPLLTKMLLTAATKLQSYSIYIILGVLIAAGLAFVYIRTPAGRYRWDKLLLSLPLVGRIKHLNEIARFCKSVALLYRAGLPLTEIMTMVIENSSNRVMTEALADVQQGMMSGEGLSRPMAKNDLFLPMMVQMVRVGEETGNLDTTLSAVAQSYEAEAEEKTSSLIALIQPAMTLIIGLIVGLITISLVSAMYSIYGQMP